MKQLIVICLLFFSSLAYSQQINEKKQVGNPSVDSLYTIVFDSQTSYSDKFEAAEAFGSISLKSDYSEKLLLIFRKLLEDGKKKSNKKGLFFCYNALAEICLDVCDEHNTKMYLDSASMYVDQVGDIQCLATYYCLLGQYIKRYFPGKSPEAVANLQKALVYFEKSGIEGKEESVISILRNLTFDGLQRGDTAYMRRNIDRLKEIRKRYDVPTINFNIMDLTSALYEEYFYNTGNESFIDSAICYTQKCINYYESGLLPKCYSLQAIDSYTIMAESLGKKHNLDVARIDSFLNIVKMKYDKNDSIGFARVYLIEATVYLRLSKVDSTSLGKNKLDSAEVYALKAMEYLEKGYKYNYYSMIIKNLDLLVEIDTLKGDYKSAIFYNEMSRKKCEEIRANEVKEQELLFETDKKLSEIERLRVNALYQGQHHRMILIIFVLLCFITVFFFLWVISKRIGLNRHIKLINTEKEDAKLMLKLKEEQAVKAELEKYEVLSDFHLKEMELIGRDKDLEQLRKDKEDLDKQVELYSKKIDAYEASLEVSVSTDEETMAIIVSDLEQLIKKRLPKHPDFIVQLGNVDDLYITSIRNKYDGNLSTLYLKYCICFYIGMGTGEVAECFSIEQSSVHMVRYRLKKKFGLNNDDDLDVYLRSF